MAIGFILEFPNGTEENYWQVMDKLDLGEKLPPGAIFHAAGPIENGWRVVDVWESEGIFQQFLQTRLGSALASAGLAEPHVSAFPVLNTLK